MAIKALAAQAKPTSADTLRRFIATSTTYLGLRANRHPDALFASEFIDPPRYRCSALVDVRRCAA